LSSRLIAEFCPDSVVIWIEVGAVQRQSGSS